MYPIAGIGEKRFLPSGGEGGGEFEFQEPMLKVIDVDLTGVIDTVSLAVQQMRRQEVDSKGFRGKSEWLQAFLRSVGLWRCVLIDWVFR